MVLARLQYGHQLLLNTAIKLSSMAESISWRVLEAIVDDEEGPALDAVVPMVLAKRERRFKKAMRCWWHVNADSSGMNK